nr:DUF5689 domain-containing protein [uncultured Carboxylicivirga sp.]
MRLLKLNIYILLLAFVGFSCSEDPDAPTPPGQETPDATKTIKDLKALVTGDDAYEIPADYVIKAVVLSNQGESNNFYRSLFIQDDETAIKISCEKESLYETLKQGQEVTLVAEGLYVAKSYDTYVIGSAASDDNYKVTIISPDKLSKVLIAGEEDQTFKTTEITDLSKLSADMVGSWVKISNVQVVESQIGSVLADGTTSYGTVNMTDANGVTFQISTNQYANFADFTMPEGSGSISGILGTYSTNFQVTLTSTDDLDLTGERFEVDNGGNLEGTGTNNDPYTITDVLSTLDDGSISGWVKGYIVGTIPATSEATLTGPFSVNTNMLIAESADETDVAKMVSVQLPAGAIRTALNLQDNESNLGKEVMVLGSLEYYFGFKGIKSLTGYWIDGAGIDPDNRTEDAPTAEADYPDGSFYFENFENAMADMDIYITGMRNLAQTGERFWRGAIYSNNTYAQATAYNSTDATNDIWMVTPAISLDGKTNPTFNCDLKGGYDNGATIEVYVLTDFDGSNAWDATATQLQVTLPSVPSSGYGADWESSGDIDLSSFSGTIHIAFKYSGGEGKTTTWQVDNINCFEK